MNSFLTNSVILVRHGDGPLFVASGEKVFCRLDRYAIIPVEHYESLKGIAEEESKETAMSVIARVKEKSMKESE